MVHSYGCIRPNKTDFIQPKVDGDIHIPVIHFEEPQRSFPWKKEVASSGPDPCSQSSTYTDLYWCGVVQTLLLQKSSFGAFYVSISSQNKEAAPAEPFVDSEFYLWSMNWWWFPSKVEKLFCNQVWCFVGYDSSVTVKSRFLYDENEIKQERWYKMQRKCFGEDSVLE